jgi:hypothetical protein
MVFLGPVLAQIATLSVADRTEARRVVLDDTHYEGSTRPQLGLGLAWQHFKLSLGYGPTITLLPLDASHPDVLVYHNAIISGAYSWEHSVLTVSESVGYGRQNFRVLALSAPVATTPTLTPNGTGAGTTGTGTGIGSTGTGTGTGSTGTGTGTPTGTGTTGSGTGTTGTGTGTTGTTRAASSALASNQVVHYFSSTTTVALDRHSSNNVLWHGELGYLVFGAAREEEQINYPLLWGPRALASVKYRVARAEEFTVALSAQYSKSSQGSQVWLGLGSFSWTHHFDPNTQTQLGAGLGGSRTPLTFGFVMYQISPTFLATYSHAERLARGTLGVSFSANAAPVIDQLTATADPRVTTVAAVSWRRDQFSSFVTGDSTFSTAAPSNTGSVTAVGAGAGMAYQFSKVLTADTGFRMAYQTFQGATVIPLAYAVFVGLSFGFQTPL